MSADSPEGSSAGDLGLSLRAPADLPRALRPREKLASAGPGALSAVELIALVVGSGSRGEPVQRIAARLLRRHGLAGLADLEADALRGEPGLGVAGASRLAACCELGRRIYRSEGERRTIGGPAAAHREVRHLGRAKKEHLVGLYLDAQNGLLHRETISVGSLNTTRTHPREILYPAIAHLAMGFILAHNHPSGCLDPSAEDVEFTRAVRRAGELMGIELYDHLVVARGGFVSLRERGLL
jgi:DNA repair protein RadC